MPAEHVQLCAFVTGPETVTIVLRARHTGAWLDVAPREASRMTWARLQRIAAHLLGEARRRARVGAARYGTGSSR